MPGVQKISNKNYINLAAVSACIAYVVFAGKHRILKSIVVTLSVCTVTAIYEAYRIRANKYLLLLRYDNASKIQALFRGHRVRILMVNTVQEALQMTQIKSVKEAMERLGQLVADAKNLMSPNQYQAIRQRYPHYSFLENASMCRSFFAELAAQIQDNKNHTNWAFNTGNVRSLLVAYVPNYANMLLSKEWATTFNNVMVNTVEAALEMPQFNSVLTESDKKKSPMGQLGQLVAYAQKQMSTQQYQYIKRIYPNTVGGAFFRELANRIQVNKDHATFALPNVLRYRYFPIPIPEGTVEDIRAWFKLPMIMENIKSVGMLGLGGCNLHALPDELKYFTSLSSLGLQNNRLTSIEALSELKQLKLIYLRKNQIESVDLSALTGLEKLSLSDNQLKRVEGLSNLKQLKMLDLSKNQIERLEGLSKLKQLKVLDLSKNQIERLEGLSKLKQLKVLGLSGNPLESVDLSALTGLELLSFSGNKPKELSKLKQLKVVDCVNEVFFP